MRLESKGKISQPTQGNGGVKLSSFQELAKTGYTHHGVSCAVLPSLLIKYRMSLSLLLLLLLLLLLESPRASILSIGFVCSRENQHESAKLMGFAGG